MSSMKEIDMHTWDRKEHFDFFSQMDIPFYNINCEIDITGLKEYTEREKTSFTNTLMFLITQEMIKVPNFRYRIINGKVFEYESLDPSFACLKEYEELFRFITVDFIDALTAFDKKVKQAVASSTAYFDLSNMAGRYNFYFSFRDSLDSFYGN